MSTPRIRVAYLADTIVSDTAGTEKQLLETIRRLDRNAFEPFLICLWQSDWLKTNGVPCPVEFLGYKGFVNLSFPGVLRRYVSLLEQHRFDIVQTLFEDSVFVAYLGEILSREPAILLSSRRDIGLGGGQPWYHGLFTLARSHIHPSFRGIVVNAEGVKRHVMDTENVPESKLKVITNGIRMPDRVCQLPPLLAADPDATWIVITANLKPVKRLDVFLHALSTLEQSSKVRFRAAVLGEGPERQRLLEMTRELRLEATVSFVGKVPDVLGYLQHANIGVICSDREGLSNAVLEYMACGLPVVATSVGGNSELVDESNGVLVPPGDVEALAGALRSLGEHPLLCRGMGIRSLEKVKAGYSWERSLAELESYYRGIVNGR